MKVTTTEKAKKARNEISLGGPGTEVLELRLYLKDSKLLWVDPIDPEEFKEGKSKASIKDGYKVDLLTELGGEIIGKSTPVMFLQNSPACSYWFIYWTENGIEQVCLY